MTQNKNAKIDLQRQTKIVATLGLKSESEGMIGKLIENGVNVARLNMSHGEHAWHSERIEIVRKIDSELGKYTGILVDLAGPKIRIGDFKNEKVKLIEGEKIILTTEEIVGDEKKVFINYPKIAEELKIGGVIMLNDGKQKLIVEEIKGKEIICKIEVGGEIRSRRGVNLPGAYLSISAITEKDEKDIDFAISKKADFLGVSFVRSRQDILDLEEILKNYEWRPKIIAKIETEEALDNFDAILELVDGIMVARGDLAVEIPKERVPAIQKKMIKKANEAGKFVITATQMLSSMQFSPVPTRAEVSDVANAIYDGTDAVMLSEESAMGDFPVEAVKTMRDICVATDKTEEPRNNFINLDLNKDAIKKSSVELAKMIKAKAIIALTETGSTPFKISRFRSHLPIIALSSKLEEMKYLSLAHGVCLVSHKEINDIKELRDSIKEIAIDYELAEKGEKVVVVSGLTFGKTGTSNMLFVEEI
jgi:pyruvate kinase